MDNRPLVMLLKDCRLSSVFRHYPARRLHSATRSPLSSRFALGTSALLADSCPVAPALDRPARALKKGTRNHENLAIASDRYFSRNHFEQFVSPRLGFGGRVFRD